MAEPEYAEEPLSSAPRPVGRPVQLRDRVGKTTGVPDEHNSNERGSYGMGLTLTEPIGIDLLDRDLADDVILSIEHALDHGVVFPAGNSPLTIFQASVADSIRDIEAHPKGALLQRFLTDGPYEGDGPIPAAVSSKRLSDAETASAVAFVLSHVVNSFKGALAELLALRPCVQLTDELKRGGRIPQETRIFAGDAVAVRTSRGHFAKGADLHLLRDPRQNSPSGEPWDVVGVVEVKSARYSQPRIMRQVRGQLTRCRLGIRVMSEEVGGESIHIATSPLRVAVVPSRWLLPRTFTIEESEASRLWQVERPKPPAEVDRVIKRDEDEYRIIMRWSEEALANAAFEVTSWYMSEVGRVIYREGVPDEWSEMSPVEAGINSAKKMLYYAILRSRSRHEVDKAIALYNAYGFGFALGMSFKDKRGHREMLWFEDLKEIAAAGRTTKGFTIKGS